MSLPDLPDPVLVTTPKALRSLATTLAKEPVIAVDTESNSLYAYRERVCLIQFSTPSCDYLADPLALEDLSPLAPIFSARETEKVFHAADYDIACLKRDFGFHFKNVFDTMIASRILGRRALGLGTILRDEYGVTLNKRYQRANWGERPLPSHLLTYARLDTHFLIPLRHQLREDLVSGGRWPIAEEDFRRICKIKGRTAKANTTCWRINGAHDLSPQQAAVLQELCRYRERVARSLDRPVFKVINDQTLLDIAMASPTDANALRGVLDRKYRRLKRWEGDLLRAVERGLKAKPIKPPREPRPDGEYIERLEELRRWRKSTARRMGVNSDVVLPRDLMHTVARHAPADLESLTHYLQEVPWRLDRFGEDILYHLNKPH